MLGEAGKNVKQVNAFWYVSFPSTLISFTVITAYYAGLLKEWHCILIVFLAASSIIILNHIYSKQKKRVLYQITTAERAKEIKTPFYLLLHSFSQIDGYSKRRSTANPFWSTYQESASLLNNLEEAVAKGNGIVVTIGQDNFPSNKTARVIVDCHADVWVDNFRFLVNHCRGIIVFPEVTNSLRDEIEFVSNSENLLDKTILVMPPALNIGSQQRWNRTRSREDGWLKLSKLLKKKNIDLPRYEPSGAMLSLNKNKTISTVEKLAGNENVDDLFRAFYNSVSSFSSKWSTFDKVYPFLWLTKNYRKPEPPIFEFLPIYYNGTTSIFFLRKIVFWLLFITLLGSIDIGVALTFGLMTPFWSAFFIGRRKLLDVLFNVPTLYKEIKYALDIDQSARVLLFSKLRVGHTLLDFDIRAQKSALRVFYMEQLQRWKTVKLGVDTDTAVDDLIQLTKQNEFVASIVDRKSDLDEGNLRIRKIGMKLNEIGGEMLLLKALCLVDNKVGLAAADKLIIVWSDFWSCRENNQNFLLRRGRLGLHL